MIAMSISTSAYDAFEISQTPGAGACLALGMTVTDDDIRSYIGLAAMSTGTAAERPGQISRERRRAAITGRSDRSSG